MHIELLVEGPSDEAALLNLLPEIAGAGASFKIHPHEGKPDLLKKLPAKLRAYKSWMPREWKIVVLIDEDREDCHKLKDKMEKIAADSGMKTKTKAGEKGEYHVVNRIAIEELEAWFFEDAEAMKNAYPRITDKQVRRIKYSNPDAVPGGTCEALERVLRGVGYYPHGLSKIEVARNISMQMAPGRNRSKSFQVFREAVEML